MSANAQPQPSEDQSLTALGIDGGTDPAATHDQAYTLEDFLPVLMNLIVPRLVLTTAPTFVPKSLVDSIQFVKDGSDYKLYLYFDKAWRSVILGSSFVSQLIAGRGISLVPGGGTGIQTITATGVQALLAGSNIILTPDGSGGYTIAASYPPNTQVHSVLATRNGDAASGTVSYAHGLGKLPGFVQVIAHMGAGTPWLLRSDGTYDGTNTKTLMSWTLVGSGGGADESTTDIVNISTHGGATQSATVNALDATNLTLDWTKVGSLGAGNTIHLLIISYG